LKKKIQYPYHCTCGADGFVDVGADQTNRWPCRQCFLALVAERKRITVFHKAPKSSKRQNYSDGVHSNAAKSPNAGEDGCSKR